MDHSASRKPRLDWILALCLILPLALSTQAPANVYATRLEMSAVAFTPGGGGTVTLSFILNENADTGVTLKVYRVAGSQLVRTVNLGALAKGSQTWIWNGKNDGGSTVPLGEPYYFTVTASDDGHTDWTQLSTDAGTCKYYHTRGLALNTNPASRYYGRVYVAENGSTNSLGVPLPWSGSPKATTDGIYILNADCSDAVGQGDAARTGGVPWLVYVSGPPIVTNMSSPQKVAVGEDDQVYVCDWSDAHAGVWVGDPDFLAAQSILDPSGSTNHGSVSDVMATGIGPTRVLYTMDEDYPGGASLGSVWQYDIGCSPLPWWARPSRAYNDDSTNRIQNMYNGFTRDSDGNWYISQERGDGADVASVIKVAADQTLLFHSYSAWGGRDPLRNTRGIGLDDARDRVALATYSMGRLEITNKDFDLENMVTLCPMGVWAVGAGGVILRSTDRGATWISVTSPTINDLNSVFMRTYGVGYAVGASGTFLRTTDGGVSWTAPSSPAVTNLNAVRGMQISTTYYVWAVGAGGGIYRSADSGTTWSTIAPPTGQDLNSVDNAYGYLTTTDQLLLACGNGGVIAKSTDSGATWASATFGTTENLNSIGMATYRIVYGPPRVVTVYGWAVGANGTILRTTDAGATWTPQVVAALSGKNLKSVSVVSAMAAKVVADDGTVARTKDGGANWTVVTSGASGLSSVRFIDPALGWAVGSNGTAIVSKNGGATWTAQATGTGAALNGVFALELPEPYMAGVAYSTWRDAAFDAVGNLYAVDNNLENLRVYSPPDGPNSSTTASYGVVVPSTGDTTPPSVPVVTDDGVEQNSGATLHATWTASSDPESGVVEYACAISGLSTDIGRGYVAGWQSVGTATEYTFTGLDLRVGTYYFLVKAKNGAGIWGDAGFSDGITVVRKFATIGEIKACKDENIIFENNTNPCIVTYVDPGDLYGAGAEKWFWVEQLTPDGGLGAAGLKVNATALGAYFPPLMTAGAKITKMTGTLVLPTTQTDTILDMTRELRLDATPTVGSYVDLPPFLCMTAKSYGGGWRTNVANPGAGDGTPAVIGGWLDATHAFNATGLNTEGLLTRVSGKVLGYGEDAAKGWMWCYIDDGSGVPCEKVWKPEPKPGVVVEYTGIKVIKAWSAIPTFPRLPGDIGKQVIVEGICCNRYIGATITPPVPASGRIRMMLMRTGFAGADIDNLQFISP